MIQLAVGEEQLYYKHLLQVGFPFVEIEGLDLLNTEQVSQAIPSLKQVWIATGL
jgi:hypothetical protein